MPVLRENDSVEIEFRAEISGGDDILDRNCRRFDDINTKFTECLADSLEGGVNMINGGGASVDDLCGSENKIGGFGPSGPMDEPREVVRVVIAPSEIYRKAIEGDFLSDIGGSNDVLDVDQYCGGEMEHFDSLAARCNTPDYRMSVDGIIVGRNK